jgi:hypothetical protein
MPIDGALAEITSMQVRQHVDGKRGHDEVLLRLACLTVAHTVAVLRLLPMSDRGTS